MPHFTLSIDNRGPLLNVQLTVSGARADALTRAGRPIPTPVAAKGLVDTGASCTTIDPHIVAALSLEPIGEVSMVTPSTGATPITMDQFDIGVTIYAGLEQVPMRIPVLPVAQAPLQNQGFEVLIGRDILARCVLVYNGAMNQYTLSF